MTRFEGRVTFEVSGRDLALLHSATFMLANWRFRGPEALLLIADRDRAQLRPISDKVFRDVKRVLSSANPNLWDVPSNGWTQAFVDSRSTVRGTIECSAAELEDLILALRACYAELGDEHGWIDFVVASPGDVGAYGVQPGDLLSMASRLEQVPCTS